MSTELVYPDATIVVKELFKYPDVDLSSSGWSNIQLAVVSFVISSNVNSHQISLDSVITYTGHIMPAIYSGTFNVNTVRESMIKLAFEKIQPFVNDWHVILAGVNMPEEVYELRYPAPPANT